MSAPSQRRRLTRKRLNNALAQVYREHPEYFRTPPTKMSFFEHVHAGNMDDVQEFLEEEDFRINMRDENGNTGLFFAMDGSGGLPMVKLLHDNGADLNAMNNIGEVPFHILCRNLLTITPEQAKILKYMVNQPDFLLIPFYNISLENVFLQATDDIASYQDWYLDAIEHDEENLVENVGKLERERAIQGDLLDILQKITELSENYLQYVNVVPSGSSQRAYYFLDTRMTGAQLKEFIQKHMFRNPSMRLDFFLRGEMIDPEESLLFQRVNDETTITYQVRLRSGIRARVGGKRKTQRRLRKR